MRKIVLTSLSVIFIGFFMINNLGYKIFAYDKKVKFSTPEEAIDSFIKYSNIYDDINGVNKVDKYNTEEFNESISEKFKVYIKFNKSYMALNEIPIYENYTLKEVSLEDNYILNSLYRNYIENNTESKVRVFSLRGKGVKGSFSRDDFDLEKDRLLKENDKEEYDFFIVAIDNGNGYVVDYCINNLDYE